MIVERHYDDILTSLMASNRGFVDSFRAFMEAHSLSIADISIESGIPESTLYKLLSGEGRDFRVSTLRRLMDVVRSKEVGDTDASFVAVITTRSALQRVERTMVVDGHEITIREYPAITIEEAIIQGVRGEREGAIGILCGPITAFTVSKLVDIPVVGFEFSHQQLEEALGNLMRKIGPDVLDSIYQPGSV